MDKFLKICLSSPSDDNYLSENDASTQALYLNNRIFSDFFQNENCWGEFSCSAIATSPYLSTLRCSKCSLRKAEGVRLPKGQQQNWSPFGCHPTWTHVTKVCNRTLSNW